MSLTLGKLNHPSIFASRSRSGFHILYKKPNGKLKEASRNFYGFFYILIGCEKDFKNFRTNHSVGSRFR